MAQYTEVRAGQIIARLDERPILRGMQRLQTELAPLHTDLPPRDPAATRPAATQPVGNSQQLAVEIEHLRLAWLESRLAEQIERVRILHSQKALPLEPIGAAVIADSDEPDAAGDVEDQPEPADSLRDRIKAARARLEKLSPSPETDKALAAARSALASVETRLTDLEAQIEQLDIRSPISGRVTLVHQRPATASAPATTLSPSPARSAATSKASSARTSASPPARA